MTSHTKEPENLLGRFLVSQPQTRDSYFAQTVVIVCSHSPQGSWGLVCNKPILDPERQEQVWRYLGWESGRHPDDLDLWEGGPVLPDRVIVLHSNDWQGPATQELCPGIGVTQDPTIFEAIHAGQGPSNYKIFLGFCGWSPGQLDGEQSGQPPWTPQHRWLTVDSRPKMIMSVASQELQWHRALELTARAAVDSWF